MSSPRPVSVGWLLLPSVLAVALAGAWWLRPGPGIAPPGASGPLPMPIAASPAPGAPNPNTPTVLPADQAQQPTQRTDAAPRAPQLVGRLVQRGRPLPNALLRLYTNTGHVPTATDRTVTTGADGAFATEGLAKPFWLAAEHESVPAEWRTYTFAPVREDHDLGSVEPPPAVAFDLQVVDEAGNPVASPRCWVASIDVHVALDPRDARAPRCRRGDSDGRVRLDRLQPGILYLKVDAEGFAMQQKRLELDPEKPPEPLRIQLTRGGRLVGRVFDWRDRPLPGATVRCEGRQTTTDDEGTFALQHYGGVEAVHIEAKRHQPKWVGGGILAMDVTHINLQRAVVLRGVVRGGNDATSVVLAPAPLEDLGLPWPGPNELIASPQPVAADGTFAIEGLEASNYTVHARAEGLGGSASQLVKLRDDATIELAIDPAASMELRVVDAEGRPVAPIELACSLAVLEYPDLFGSYGKDVVDRLFHGARRVDLPARGERIRIAVPRDAPLALGVRSRGFLPVVRVFEPGLAPAELVLELPRAGGLRGVVHGGAGDDVAQRVAYWPAADDAAVRARKQEPKELPVDAQGRFHRDELPPGAYFAAVSRGNRGYLGRRAFGQAGGIPFVDEGMDLRSAIEVVVAGGAAAEIELHDPPLGTLRGRVLQAGRPVAGALVVAARPGARLFGDLVTGDEIDWNDEVDLEYVPGQRTAADGSFVFLYRDAGPLELRARHAAGAGTMPPVVVDLPPPGRDVHRDLELALGGVRGRFVASAPPASPSGRLQAVLFPLDKAAKDPLYSSEWSPSVASSCTNCEIGADGSFLFANVPNGEWVVRITDLFSSVFARRTVVVDGSEVDVGELRAAAPGSAKLAWGWRVGTSQRQTHGVWLYEARAGRPAIWVGTFAANATGADCASLAPGKYLGVVFGAFGESAEPTFWGTFGGLTGEPLGEPFPFELRPDGATVPATIELVPVAEPAVDRR